MAKEQNPNSGILFESPKKPGSKRPDFKGTINITKPGTYEIVAWTGFTKKDKILFCGYHGWQDWYLSANLKSNEKLNEHLLPGLEPLGVPKGLKGSVIPFRFNNWKDLENIVKKNAKDCAAIVLEPCREKFPDKEYLQELRNIANKNKCVLIFDEITSGWRINTGGAHQKFKINPDIVLYDAGVDVHQNDKLGNFKISTEGINKRDQIVIENFYSKKIPLCGVLGGGYNKSFDKLIELHSMLHKNCAEYF